MNGKVAKRIRKATKLYMRQRGVPPDATYPGPRGEKFDMEKMFQRRAKKAYLRGELMLRKVAVPK